MGIETLFSGQFSRFLKWRKTGAIDISLQFYLERWWYKWFTSLAAYVNAITLSYYIANQAVYKHLYGKYRF